MSDRILFDAVYVAPNTALDLYAVVDRLEVGAVSRGVSFTQAAGGKGINAARAMALLGGSPMTVGLFGGGVGHDVLRGLIDEGLPAHAVAISGETRRTLTIASPPGDTTVLLENGPGVLADEVKAFENEAFTSCEKSRWAVLTGSLPTGFAPEFFQDLILRLRVIPGLSIALDASGAPLECALRAGPDLVKVNADEFASAFGYRVPDESHALPNCYAEVAAYGVRTLVVTAGPRGAYIVGESIDPFLVITPAPRVLCTAGAGDTFLSAMLLALIRGDSLEAAATYASAAASASLGRVICGDVDPGETQVERVRTEVRSLDR